MSEAPGVGVLTTDRALVVRTWNHWLAAATGEPEERVCGQHLGSLVGGPTAEWYGALFEEVLASGTPRVLAPAFHRYLIPCPPVQPGTHFDRMQQRVTVAPLRDGAEILGLIVTIEDVTARIEAERLLSTTLQSGGSHAGVPLEAIGAEDWRLRRIAVARLRQQASPDDLRRLIDSLQRDHHNLNLLSSALQVLIAAGLDVATPLVTLLSDPEPNLRMHAALALGQLGSDVAVAPLVSALEDSDDNVRFHAIEALGRLKASDAAEALAAIATSADFFLAFAAIDALAHIDDPRVAGHLAGMLRLDAIAPAAIDALGTLGDEDCVLPLVEALNGNGGEAGAIAAALERIHRRYEEASASGAYIIDLVAAAITDAGVRRLTEALEQQQQPGRPLVAVLGWVGSDALDVLVKALSDATVQASAEAAILRHGRLAVEPLLNCLERGGRQERVAAAALLGRLGDRRAVPSLMALLESTDADLVAVAATALAGLGDARALDALLPLFAHEHAIVRQAAVGAVSSIGAQDTGGRIRSRLGDADSRVRECAVRVAGYFGFDDCRAGILESLHDPDPVVRRAAIEQLAVLDDATAVPRLVAALKDETARNRGAAAHALRVLTDPVTAQALVEALDDDDAWVRYFAAASLGRRGVGAAAPRLVRVATEDGTTHVRIAALQALGQLCASELVSVTEMLWSRAEDDVAAAALAALGGISAPGVMPMLERAVRSPSLALRMAAVDALAVGGTAEGADLLAWAARADAHPDVWIAAVEGLARMAQRADSDRRERAVDHLLELTGDDRLREAALMTLAGLPEGTIATLAAVLHRQSRGAVRLAAVEALCRMCHPDASAALVEALADPDPAVRGAAVDAFGRLGSPAARDAIERLASGDADAGVRRRAVAVCRRHRWTGKVHG